MRGWCQACALFMAMLFSPFIYSQDIFWTESVRGVRDADVIGCDGDAFFVAEEDQKSEVLRIVRYDSKSAKPKLVREIKIGGDESGDFEFAVMLKDQFHVYTSVYNKEDHYLRAYCTQISTEGNVLSDSVLVHSIRADSRSSAPDFGYTLSPDSSLILLYFDPPYERKSTESLAFKCYDVNLDMQWEKDVLLPYTQEIVQVHSFLLDALGNVYMMSGRNPSKSGNNFQKPQGGRYVVFYYNAKSKKLKEYDISLKDKQILSVAFTTDGKGDVRIAGYYTNDFRFSAAGTFLFTIGREGGPVQSAAYMPFSKELLSHYMRRSAVETSPALPDYYLDHIICVEDSSLLLVGEQYYSSEVLITDPTTGRQTVEYRYNFDDLLVIRLDASGRQVWSVKIPKEQFTSGSTANCSYVLYTEAGRLHIYFNDDDENQQELSETPQGDAYAWNGARNSVTTCVTVESDGRFVRGVLLSNKEADALLNPAHSSSLIYGAHVMQYNDGKLIKYAFVSPPGNQKK